MLIFLAVIGLMGGTGAYLARDVGKALPDVGKDAQGDDPWTDPVGVELLSGFQVGHIPDCAAAPIVGIILMDPASRPYWQVTGPPSAMTTFVVGATPKGFKVVVPLKKPPRSAVLRLVVIRTVKGSAGVRYQTSDLRTKRVAAMLPISRFTIAGFQTADVCGLKNGKAKGTTGTTLPTGLGG
ncbi:MAG: hypothetical protein JWM05_2126 [Acidimicrobiales bacterium]|nr:hypothetical protein [Acidimicrobiales bacterium]